MGSFVRSTYKSDKKIDKVTSFFSSPIKVVDNFYPCKKSLNIDEIESGHYVCSGLIYNSTDLKKLPPNFHS